MAAYLESRMACMVIGVLVSDVGRMIYVASLVKGGHRARDSSRALSINVGICILSGFLKYYLKEMVDIVH